MSAGKVFQIKANSAWNTIAIPPGDQFEDLIEFQELNDYEFIEDMPWKQSPKLKTKTGKKKKKDEVTEDLEELVKKGNEADFTTSSKRVKKRKRKKAETDRKKAAKKAKLNESELKDEDAESDIQSPVIDHASLAEADSSTSSKKGKKIKKKKVEGDRNKATKKTKLSDSEDNAESDAESPDIDDASLAETMTSWKQLGVSDVFLKALKESGFTDPTPIQIQAIPHAIHHRLDIVGAAETGSGKTLAFGLPVLEFILQHRSEQTQGPSALILEPTRELALQVRKHLKSAARFTDIQVVTIVGGMAPQKQTRLLKRRPEIIVATPGRLWELAESGEAFLQNLHAVRQVVLDEADRMIEKGHFEELHKIFGLLKAGEPPVQRQHYIFSATMTLDHAAPHRPVKRKRKKALKDAEKKVEELIQELGMDNKPKTIDLTRKEAVVDTLTETAITCHSTEKDLYLYYLLRLYGGRTLVFCNSKDCIRRLISVFSLLGLNPLPLHADMQQRQRLKNLDRFAAQSPSVLVASDVAARGLDIPAVDHVIHYQVPFTVENYVHRSGRTARATNQGLSVVLISPEEYGKYRNILKLKQGQELEPFPVQSRVVAWLKPHVDLATRIDVPQHRLTKEQKRRNWMRKAAEEMDIELDEEDEDGDEGDGESERRAVKNALKQQKQQLAAMLKEPLIPVAYSSRYPTQTGQLLVPQSISQGSALVDCRRQKKTAVHRKKKQWEKKKK